MDWRHELYRRNLVEVFLIGKIFQRFSHKKRDLYTLGVELSEMSNPTSQKPGRKIQSPPIHFINEAENQWPIPGV
jgi:hypothetical protein